MELHIPEYHELPTDQFELMEEIRMEIGEKREKLRIKELKLEKSASLFKGKQIE